MAICHTKSKKPCQSDYLPILEREKESVCVCVCVCLVLFSVHTYQVWFSLVSLFNGKSTMDVKWFAKESCFVALGDFFSPCNYILRDTLVWCGFFV